MSPVLVTICVWVAGIVSGLLLGAQDRKHNIQSTIGLLLVPLLCMVILVLLFSLMWEIVPLISLESASAGILEFFSHE